MFWNLAFFVDIIAFCFSLYLIIFIYFNIYNSKLFNIIFIY